MTTTRRRSWYQEHIAKIAHDLDLHVDPRHVEAWMRSDFGTLCHLDGSVFVRYAKATERAGEDELDVLEELAQMDRL